MNDNRTIHEAMGFCWHEKEVEMIVGQHPKHDCCGRSKCFRHVVDYTEPVNYCALMDWMKSNERWGDFRGWYEFDIETFLELPRQDQVALIAEAIREGVLK